MSFRGVVEAFGAVVLLASCGVALSYLSRKFEFGPMAVPLLIFFGGLVIGAVLLFHRRNIAVENPRSTGGKPKMKLSLGHCLGLIVMFVGLAIGLGNITGVMRTLSNAGSIVAAVGAVIYSLSKPRK
jgi:hypothetical protein